MFVILGKSSESVDRLLLERFKKVSRFPEAFSSVQYWGTQTLNPPTDFGGLLNKLEQLLDNNATRSPRTPVVIYKALRVGLCLCVNISLSAEAMNGVD